MDVTIKNMAWLPCEADIFTINGMKAKISDFGDMEDVDWKKAEPFSCKCMKFVPNGLHNEDAEKKYGISSDEFRSVQRILEEKMYVGFCSMCVINQ